MVPISSSGYYKWFGGVIEKHWEGENHKLAQKPIIITFGTFVQMRIMNFFWLPSHSNWIFSSIYRFKSSLFSGCVRKIDCVFSWSGSGDVSTRPLFSGHTRTYFFAVVFSSPSSLLRRVRMTMFRREHTETHIFSMMSMNIFNGLLIPINCRICCYFDAIHDSSMWKKHHSGM